MWKWVTYRSYRLIDRCIIFFFKIYFIYILFIFFMYLCENLFFIFASQRSDIGLHLFLIWFCIYTGEYIMHAVDKINMSRVKHYRKCYDTHCSTSIHSQHMSAFVYMVLYWLLCKYTLCLNITLYRTFLRRRLWRNKWRQYIHIYSFQCTNNQ